MSQEHRPLTFGDVLPVSGTLASQPVTKEDAALMQRSEEVSFGHIQKGGVAASMQSAADKNVDSGTIPSDAPTAVTHEGVTYGDVLSVVGALHEAPPVTKEDAALMQSAEARTLGHTQKGGIAASMQSIADKSMQAPPVTNGVTYGDVFPVEGALATQPITKEDAALMQRAEALALGSTQKGGAAATMQSAADYNVQTGAISSDAHGPIAEEAGVTVVSTVLPNEGVQTQFVVAGQPIPSSGLPTDLVSATAKRTKDTVTIGEDASSKLVRDKTVTWEDAERVAEAELRNSPTGEIRPTGVAAALVTAADLNEKMKTFLTQRESYMGGFWIFVLVLASCLFLSKAEIHLSNTVKYEKHHLVFSLYESSKPLFPCNESSSIKNSSPLFASHQMPNGAVLDLCLESSGRIYFELSTHSKVNSLHGLEVLDSERKLLGNGAHRELRSSVTIKLENIETCNMVLVERLSSGVFVDKFELEGLVARGVYVEAVLYGDHNLELPALQSSQSMVVIHKSFSSKSEDLLQVEVGLPLHARYPPLSSESHVPVGFKFPILLFQCLRKGDNALDANVNATWALLTKKESSQLDSSELQWLVPAGNPLHSKIVATLTTCTSFIGVVTLWAVSKHSYRLQKLKEA